jgi:hypothetical protein
MPRTAKKQGGQVDPAILEAALEGLQRRLADIEDKIGQVKKLLGSPSSASSDNTASAPAKRTMSPAARKRIAEAQRRRWAAFRARAGRAQRKRGAKAGQEQAKAE